MKKLPSGWNHDVENVLLKIKRAKEILDDKKLKHTLELQQLDKVWQYEQRRRKEKLKLMNSINYEKDEKEGK